MGVNSLPWYYLPTAGILGDMVTLEGDEWHHCYRVMRLKEGDDILVCDGQGLCMRGTIRSASSHNGRIELTENLSDVFANQRDYKLFVGIAPTKNMDRTEFAVEKMTELGVSEIFFLEGKNSERTHLRLDRMHKIMVGAAKQSRKSVFPLLHDMITPSAMITLLQKSDPAIHILACHLDDDTQSLDKNYMAGKDVVLMIGPEGGFSPEEIMMMQEHQVKLTSLGPFRLRVETAAIAACANIHLINEMNTHK